MSFMYGAEGPGASEASVKRCGHPHNQGVKLQKKRKKRQKRQNHEN